MIKNAEIFIAASVLLTILSLAVDRKKTVMGIKKGIRMLMNIGIPFINVLILISAFLYFLPPHAIQKYLGAGSGVMGIVIAAAVGSISLIPGFIAYPIAAAAIRQGASYTTAAVFMTTLMMVGIITLPLEIKFFGRRAAVLRNVLNFIAAIIIGLFVGAVL